MTIAERSFTTTERPQARGKWRSFMSREIVCHQDDPVTDIYRIETGAVMLYQILRDGRRQIVDVLYPGDYFGFGDGTIQDCFAETLMACDVIAWRRDDAFSTVEWCHAFTAAMQRKLGAMHDHVTLLGKKTALERVATFLMRFVPECSGRLCNGAPPADYGRATHDVYMSRREIADYLGLTLETVSRAISQLKREGMIEAPRPTQIAIKEICRMCKIAALH